MFISALRAFDFRISIITWGELAEGFAQAAKYIQAAGRPLTSFCACELRSPAAFTEDGFRRFNEHYVKTLAEWGIFDGTTTVEEVLKYT